MDKWLGNVFLVILVCISHALFGAVRVDVSPKTVEVGESLQITVTVENEKDDPSSIEIDFPENVSFQRQKMDIRSINGVSSLSKSWVIAVDAPGVLKLPNAIVQFGKSRKEVAIPPIHVVASNGGPLKQAPQADPGQDEHDELPPVFLEREFNAKKVYVGQALPLIGRLYVQTQSREPDQMPLPGLADFRVQNFPAKRSQAQFGQKIYYLIEYPRIVIPLKAGAYTYPGDQIEMSYMVGSRFRGSIFDLFPQQRIKKLTTPADNLTVLPLPSNDPLAKNFSGIVGQMEATAQLSKEAISVGETATLSVTLRSNGALDTLAVPTLPQLAGLKVYDDQPEGTMNLNDASVIESQHIFRYALVPNQPGEFDLGRLTWVIFDPVTASYRQIVVPLGRIVATGLPQPNAASLEPGSPSPGVKAGSEQESSALKDKHEKKIVDSLTALAPKPQPAVIDRWSLEDWLSLAAVWAVAPLLVGCAVWWTGPRRERVQRLDLIKKFKETFSPQGLDMSAENTNEILSEVWTLILGMIRLAELKAKRKGHDESLVEWQLKKRDLEKDMQDVHFSGRKVQLPKAKQLLEKMQTLGLEVKKCL